MKLKYNFINFTFEQLFLSGLHLGQSIWNSKSKIYILGYKKSLYILRLDYTFLVLRKLVFFVLNVLKVRHELFFFDNILKHNLKFYLNKNLPCFFLNKSWIGGMLTNWKNNYKYHLRKNLPALIIVFHADINNWVVQESKCLNLPLAGLVNSGSNMLGLNYPLPSNNFNKDSILFYCSFFTTLLFRGKQEERLNFFLGSSDG